MARARAQGRLFGRGVSLLACRIEPASGNRTHCVEGTWGAQIVDELAPQESEHLVVLETQTQAIRGGIEHNYRMILVSDAVAEVDRTTHEAELRTMA